MTKNVEGIEKDLIIHLEVAADQIAVAISLIKDGKSLSAHDKIERAFKRLMAADSLYNSKHSSSNQNPMKLDDPD